MPWCITVGYPPSEILGPYDDRESARKDAERLKIRVEQLREEGMLEKCKIHIRSLTPMQNSGTLESIILSNREA